MRGFRRSLRALPGLFLLATANMAVAAGGIVTAIPQITSTRTATLCAVVTPGQSAGVQQALDEFRQAALTWGVEISARPYQNATQASADFRSGLCDLINLPGEQARDFNRFSATLEAIGAVPDHEHLLTALRAFALDKATPLLRTGEYEVVSVWPAGTCYLQLNNRQWQEPAQLAGRTLADDANADDTNSNNTNSNELRTLAALTGMQRVNASSRADAQVVCSNTDNLAKVSSTSTAGLLPLPLHQRTQQIIARHDALPDTFGPQARHYSEQQFDHWLTLLGNFRLPASAGIILLPTQQAAWNQLFQQARMQLRNEGIYDAGALTLLRKVRCAQDAHRLECAEGQYLPQE